jgi:MFS family permease
MASLAPISPVAQATRLRIVLVFAAQAIVGAMMNARIPDIQVHAELGEGALGYVLVGQPIGAFAVFALTTRLIERFGTRRIILVSYVAMALCVALLPVWTNPALLFTVLLLYGALGSLSNITINVEADRVEAATGARLMNRCHGAWSVSYFVSSAIAGLIRGAGIDPAVHLWVMAPIFTIGAVALVAPMMAQPSRPYSGDARPVRFAWPTLAILPLFAFGIGAQLLEGASRVWATIYLRDAFSVAAVVQSAAFPAFVLTMAGGRLLADRWLDAYGPRRTATVLMAIAFAGLAALVFAPNAYVAICGFALAGLGAGIAYPLMISSVAKLGDRPASENVAATTLLVQVIMLASPIFIGSIAQGFSIRAAFGCLLPLVALSLVMTRSLR